ncbi:hypothetical protein JW935_07540 [candidate division KSB1 bacterium]|nr:hypothetical protein [candidate division KSB1 bacterium]
MRKTANFSQKSETKREYRKPSIIHSSNIETVAGRCSQSVGCTPSQVGHSEPGD